MNLRLSVVPTDGVGLSRIRRQHVCQFRGIQRPRSPKTGDLSRPGGMDGYEHEVTQLRHGCGLWETCQVGRAA